MSKERCKDLIGKRARLLRDVSSAGGTHFLKGLVVTIGGTHRGRYSLEDTDRCMSGPGWNSCPRVTCVQRSAFEVLSDSIQENRS